jgi:hypothetical protein
MIFCTYYVYFIDDSRNGIIYFTKLCYILCSFILVTLLMISYYNIPSIIHIIYYCHIIIIIKYILLYSNNILITIRTIIYLLMITIILFPNGIFDDSRHFWRLSIAARQQLLLPQFEDSNGAAPRSWSTPVSIDGQFAKKQGSPE